MVSRLVLVLLWTLPAMLIQSFLLLLPWRAKERFACVYWRGVGLLLGLRLTVIGARATQRPVLFVANHSSWLDIVALGGILPGCFIAKAAIGEWPFIKWIARLGRTIFVSRTRATVAREHADLCRRLAAGDNVILFPEGTTSDGVRILPFSPAFLALAEAPARPYVQPVTIVYDVLDALPVRRGDRPEIAWYGDMDMASHFNRIGRRRSLHATVLFDPPIAPGTFKDRKTLAATLERRLATNAAALRQGSALDPLAP